MKETIKINKNGKAVKMIAHRGLSGLETQNTASAFVAAGNRSYYGVETDVHVTRDGKFIIVHDDSLINLSGDDLIPENTDLATLRSLTLYDIDGGGKTRADLILPSLREYIRICRKYEKVCVLELKNPMSEDAICGIIDEIKDESYLDNMIFISFCYENLVVLRRLLPQAKLQFLTGHAPDEELVEMLKTHSLNLDIIWTALSKQGVELMHENGIEVNCWTLDDPEAAERLISWGVDYITTNILE